MDIEIKYESDEKFFEKLGIDKKMFHICTTIRKVLSYWLGIPAVSILADSSPNEYQCDGWDPEEFMWQVSYELNLDDYYLLDFPDFFSYRKIFTRGKKYKKVKDWMTIAITSIEKAIEAVDGKNWIGKWRE
jgi:hypothetical protein